MQKNHSQNICRSEGFSTIELLIAFSVGMIFLTAALLVSYSDPTLARQISLDSGQTTALDAVLDTNALSTSTNRIGGIVSALGSNWNTLFTSNSDTSYTTTPTVTDISPCFKEITDVTTWNTFGRTGRTMTFGTGIGNLNIAKALGRGGCDPTPSSGWATPVDDPNAAINVSGADNGTDIAVRSFNGKRYAFITSNPSGGGPKKEFSVIDVTDNNIQPSDLKTTLNKDKGLLGLVVVGNYAYVLNNDTTGNQLQIIDLTNPEAATKLPTAYTFPNLTCSYNSNTCQRVGRSIAYYNGYLFIGTGSSQAGGTNNHEFFIYCINDTSVAGCSPTTPVFRSSLNIDHNINDIAIKDGYAFLATSADYGELTVIDITSKTAPSLPPNYITTPNTNNRKFNAPATNGTEEDGTSVYVLGDYAYLGREKVDKSAEREFYVLNISNLTAITSTGAMSFNMTNSAAKISGIVVQGKTAFLSTYDSNKSFYIVDLSTPTAPKLLNSCSDDINTSQWSTALEFKDNQAYLVHAQGSVFLKIVYDNGNACTP